MNTTPLKIDFVSDVSCPWCAIGLHALEQAAKRLDGEVALEMVPVSFDIVKPGESLIEGEAGIPQS